MCMIVDVPLKTKWESLCKTLLPLKPILIDSKTPNLFLLDYAFESEYAGTYFTYFISEVVKVVLGIYGYGV